MHEDDGDHSRLGGAGHGPARGDGAAPPDLEEAILACRQVLARRPSGLLADIDGTLSPIAPTPEAAVVPSAIRDSLATLAGRIDVVVAVTGRAVDDARRMVGLDQIGYVGNHGIERWQAGRTLVHPSARPYVDKVGETLRALAASLQLPGLRFEDKGPTGSIHYRQAADPAAARARILDTLGSLWTAADLQVGEGRMVVNLLPPLALDKGRAVSELAAEHGLRGVVFLGDDVTDLDAFRALRALRHDSDRRTLGVAVLSAEAPPELARQADLAVSGVEDVGRLLAALAVGPLGPPSE